MKKRERNVDVKKATWYAIIVNGVQIALMIAIALAVVLLPGTQVSAAMLEGVVVVAAMVVIWGAVVDIREALSTRRLLGQLDDMDDTIDRMEQFNHTLRAQRHDFLNHLQVVYSLMEMEDYAEASAYIEKVYGKITSVSRVMKTANAAVNALLQVKVGECEKAGVQVDVSIQSAWKNLPVPGWEMCKVLANLIDNAIDALEEIPAGKRRLRILLTEDIKTYRFEISNNGPMIPERSWQSIFQPGITTKLTGQGMGLYIVKKTLNDREGDITLVSDEQSTVFRGWVPKEPAGVIPQEE